MNGDFSPHFCRGHIDVAFVFSAPGTEEVCARKPVAGDTGENLDSALIHLHFAQPTMFPSVDRYDYRITNAVSRPISVALGDGVSEARASEIREPENVRRVLGEIEGCRRVVLCGKKARLLSRAIRESGKPVVEVSHASNRGLNVTYRVLPDALKLASPRDCRKYRAHLWAEEVLRAIADEDRDR